MLGMDVSFVRLPGQTDRDETALFSESQGRIIATIAPESKDKFEKIMKMNLFSLVGKVNDSGTISIKNKHGKKMADFSVDSALKAHRSKFKNY